MTKSTPLRKAATCSLSMRLPRTMSSVMPCTLIDSAGIGLEGCSRQFTQILRFSGFNDPALFHDDDTVGFLHGGHPTTADTRERVVLRPQQRVWHPGLVPGLRVLSLGEFEGAHTALVEWAPGTRFQYHRHDVGEEIFVMEGGFQDECGDYPALAEIN